MTEYTAEPRGFSARGQRRRSAASRVQAQVASAALSIALGAYAASSAVAKPVTVAELLSGSPAQDWRSPDPDNTLYLQLPGGRVVIELAPRVAPKHVANIKALARA